MMVDQISEQRLQLVHPDLARRVRAAADQLAAVGTYFRVAVGMRTYAESDALYAQGRTAPGHIVSNARGGYSQHNFGLAVDCFPFLVGSSGEMNYKSSSPQFQAMVQALKRQGLAWGGDWKSIDDEPHFQLAYVPVTPTAADRAAFARGGSAAVWAQYSIKLQASADHGLWHMLLYGVVGGCAQRVGQWCMEHFGTRLLTRFRSPWDNSSPAPPEGEPMHQEEENHGTTVTGLQANAFTDTLKKLVGMTVTPDQTKAATTAVIAFVGHDGLALAEDAVNYAESFIPSAADGATPEQKKIVQDARHAAAVTKFHADAAAAKKDLSHLAGSAINYVLEGALQIAISKGLQFAAKAAAKV